MRFYSLMLTLFFLVVFTSTTYAITVHVPGDQPTIQAGIDACTDGDTVLVADGTYTGDGNRDIDFLGKAIVVMSENGAENCIIDCEADSLDQHRGFWFHHGEDVSSILQGFTIMNGYIDGSDIFGGGIKCDSSSSPTIVGNTIKENCANTGGGISCSYSSSPVIKQNVITDNTTTGDYWGGEEIWGGGGILCHESSSPLIEDNTIMRNTSAGGSGGIGCYFSSNPTILNNTIASNTHLQPGGGGGGIEVAFGSPAIIGNLIMGNVGKPIDPINYNGGGGIALAYSRSTVEGNAIVDNEASHAAGVGFYHDFSRLHGNTITGNTAVHEGIEPFGGGIAVGDSSEITIVSTIFSNNDAEIGEEIWVGYWGSPPIPSTLTISYSDVEGGQDSVYVGSGSTLNWGDGMIDDDPMFVLPDGRDHRLLWGSPCIDTGHTDSLDADGTRSDMGAHYFNQDDYLTLYLTPDMTEVPPGGQLGVTYTLINRWEQPEPFWGLTQVILPGGNPFNLIGPDPFTLRSNTTIQQHFNHNVPPLAPQGQYEYWTQIGLPPSTLYDEDRFTFSVVE